MQNAFQWVLDPWQSPLVARGGLVAILVGASAGAIGCWVILRDLPYAAESLSHGMFPGLVGAALLGLPIALGGLIGLIIAAGSITAARRWVTEDGHAVAVAITPLLGLGAILALSGPVPPGIGDSLFGDVLAANGADLAAALALAPLLLIVLHGSHWRLLAAGISGRKTRLMDGLLLCLLAVATAAAARSLGALLAVAMIIGPAAAARRLTVRAAPMLWTAALIAGLSAAVGIEVSWHADLATGPTIAICAIIPAGVLAIVKPSGKQT